MSQIARPALVVLVGPSGAGKSTWARSDFAANEIVSSDALRAVVGSGEGDLDASTDAFAVLDTVVAARVRRGLTTSSTPWAWTPPRRAAVALARGAGLPLRRGRFHHRTGRLPRPEPGRDRPVPAPALKAQYRRTAGSTWPATVSTGVAAASTPAQPPAAGVRGSRPSTTASDAHAPEPGLRFGLQISAFPWGEDPRGVAARRRASPPSRPGSAR